MRRLARPTILVALSLLISAATAQAECAWVLWQHQVELYINGMDSTVSRFFPADSYSTESACRQMADRIHRSLGGLKDDGYARTKGDGLTVGSSLKVRNICLPDTVDPRGPKGGTR